MDGGGDDGGGGDKDDDGGGDDDDGDEYDDDDSVTKRIYECMRVQRTSFSTTVIIRRPNVSNTSPVRHQRRQSRLKQTAAGAT